MHMYEDDTTRELLADVKQGVRKAQPFFPAGRGAHDDDTGLSLIAQTVVEHLIRCRWRFNRLPPPPLHSTGARMSEDDPAKPRRGQEPA